MLDPTIALDGTSSERESASRTAAFTRVTSSAPAEVSKILELKDERLVKTASANISAASVEIVTCSDLAYFANVLTQLQPSQCLLYGVPSASPMRLVTDGAWQRAGRPEGVISRTEKNFSWRAGEPGILMLDHDPQPGMPSYSPDDLVRLLRQTVPAIARVDMLTWPSSSSLIYDMRSDECLAGLKGCRIYLMVDDAACIPEVGKQVVESLWGAGHGVFTVSSSGRLLERGLFDTTVWQASRIDFAAGACCREPLEQRRGQPILHGGAVRMACAVNLRTEAMARSAAQFEAVASHKKAARSAVEVRAAVISQQFAEKKLRELEQAAVDTGFSKDVARRRARHAVQVMMRPDGAELHGDVMVTVVDDLGQHAKVSVRDILKRRSEFDGAKTLDPLEPEYDGHRPVGMLLLRGSVPRLNSFAHGGTRYKLVAQLGAVEVGPGTLHRAVDETLAILRGSGDLYDHGDAFAMIGADGRMVAITPGLVPYVLGSRVSYFIARTDKATGEVSRPEQDAPATLAKSIHELQRERRLPQLNAVITVPIIVDGRLITAQGYDETSGLYLIQSDEDMGWTPPSQIDDVRRAFIELQELFESFPFDAPADRGAFLAAMFTAVMRPGLRTAPGFAFDAPAQGTGKSLLTECVAIIGTGHAPGALPHLYDDESEVRKRLVSLLHNGAPVMIWDNIKGAFDSAVLASLLTSEQFEDRFLGETRMLRLPNRMLALFNGNNMTLRGELTRRIIVCRLDAGVERPYLRKFASSPREICRAQRLAVVQKVLTVIWGYQLHGCGFAADTSLGSFEDWSAAVLRPLLWAISLVADGRVSNPLEKIAMGEEDDDELVVLGNVHRAWHAVYGEVPKAVREVVGDVYGSLDDHGELDQTKLQKLRVALDEFVGTSVRGNFAVMLGKQLAYKKGRVVDGGRRFVQPGRKASGGVALWSASWAGSRPSTGSGS